MNKARDVGGGEITNISFVASCTLLRCVGQSECEERMEHSLYTVHTSNMRDTST